MKNEKIIIIGAVAAGSKCAFKLKREKPQANIVVYTDDNLVSYSCCGLPYFIGGQVQSSEKLIIRTPDAYREAGIDLHLKHRLTSVNPDKKTIALYDLENKKHFQDTYDKLVLATGAKAFVPKIENSDLKNIFTLRNLQNGIDIRTKMLTSKHAVIIGGGYIGIELLEAFTKNGLNVTLIEFAQHILTLFDCEISELIEKHINEAAQGKIQFIKSDYVTKFLGENGEVKKVITHNGKEIDTDFAVICVGTEPNTQYLENTGIELGIKGTIRVDKHMRTSIKDIYAIGDCAEKTNIITNKPCWVPLGSTANKEGRCCALNLAGINDEFEGVLGSTVARFNGFTMSLTGLNEREAKLNGYDYITETITKKDKAGYMPEVKNITLKVIVDKKTRKILGAQAIGCGDADKRINTITAAIMSEKKVDDLVNLDMTYAPPYSPTIDPLLTALTNILHKLEKN